MSDKEASVYPVSYGLEDELAMHPLDGPPFSDFALGRAIQEFAEDSRYGGCYPSNEGTNGYFRGATGGLVYLDTVPELCTPEVLEIEPLLACAQAIEDDGINLGTILLSHAPDYKGVRINRRTIHPGGETVGLHANFGIESGGTSHTVLAHDLTARPKL